MGLEPQDRVVPQLPNVAEFVLLYLGLQKMGGIPIAALASHRYAEIRQFVELSGARACVVPERHRDFDFTAMIDRIAADVPSLSLRVLQHGSRDGWSSLEELIHRPASRSLADLASIAIDPTDPAIFQLSGGTTGIPKLIPRTHNDYAYNSKAAAGVCGIENDSVLLVALPVAHNLPLACPGIQGFFFNGARVVLSTSTRPEHLCALIEQHRVTHLEVVPALLIRLLNDAKTPSFDLSSVRVIQSGGQSLQPETRAAAQALIPSAFIQENFGMSEGLLTFVRFDDPEDVRMGTVGTPVSPDDEVRLVDDDGNEVQPGEIGELTCRGPYTLRGYYGVPEYNARAFSPDGFYRSGDLMRQHPSGAYVVAGRKKDLINRGGEKISAEEVENLILGHPAVENVACVPVPDAVLGERMCACVVVRPGTSLTLGDLTSFLLLQDIAKFKLPERLEIVTEFPLSNIGKVSKKTLSERLAGRQTDREAR